MDSVYTPLDIRLYSTSDRLEIGEIPFITQEIRPSRSEQLKYYRLVSERRALNIICYQKVNHISKTADYFTINAIDGHNKNFSYQSRMLVFTTGIFDYPRQIGVQGEELPKVMHYLKKVIHFSVNM